jgi:hypothetical protein
MLTSLGQILLVTNPKPSAPNKVYRSLLDDPVFSPLVRASHSLAIEMSPGTHVIYDGDVASRESISWDNQSESPWWISESVDSSLNAGQSQENTSLTLPLRTTPGNPVPRLRSRDFDSRTTALRDFIALGVADLLNTLREQELKRSSEKDGSSLNPFDEALKSTSDDTATDKSNKTAASDPSKQNQGSPDKTTTNGGTTAATSRSFLFVGKFNDQPVATAAGTTKGSLLLGNNSASFEFAGIGKQLFDMDIILRDADNQESLSFGDLNKDGFPDMVVTNKATDQASIYLNDGFGNYVLCESIYGGLGPAGAVIADFSGDGSPDLAVLLQIDRRIIVDGKGLRKFIFFPTSDVNDDYSSMLPYDFNGDGLPDLLLTNYASLTSSIYLNQGNATFVQANSSAMQSYSYLQTRMDLTGDGVDDLVYVQYLGGRVAVVVVDGQSGRISNLGTMALDSSSYCVLGDFNQDGVVDIAIAHRR